MKLAVEHADQVDEVRGPVGIARELPRVLQDRIRPLMSAFDSGKRAFRTACAAFWWYRWFGLDRGELKVSSRNVTPTPSIPPTSRRVAGVHGLALDHLGEEGQPHRDDPPVLGQPGDRLVEEGFLLPGELAGPRRQGLEGAAVRRQHLAGMLRIEEVDGRDVPTRGPGRSPGLS